MTQKLQNKKWLTRARATVSLVALGLLAGAIGAGARYVLSLQSATTPDESVVLAAPLPPRIEAVSDAQATLQATLVAPSVPDTDDSVKAAVARDGFWFNADVLGRVGPQTQSLTVNGIELTASDFHIEQGRLYVNICMPAAGKEHRTLGMATLTLGAKTFDTYYAHENNLTEASRCEALEYAIGSTLAEVKDASLSINGIYLIPPLEGQECATFDERARGSNRLAELGITVSCKAESGQSPQLVVEKGNSAVDQVAAEAIAANVYNGSVEGPWVFNGSLTPSDH